MAGIYIHIPFCRSKCAYCDFYSIANIKLIDDFHQALIQEIELQKKYFKDEKIQTIYFGGGTPSILSVKQIEEILNALNRNFNIDKNNEITLEANPDDLNETYLKQIYNLGINRLSIGIQSFNSRDLKLMKRKHTVNQSVESVLLAKKTGFKNISIDLIYGLPDMTMKEWEENIFKAVELKVQHISAYHLTIEPKTVFSKYLEKGKLNLPNEDESVFQFKLLREKLLQNGYLHYEISNFAKDGSISLHNTNYWMGIKYLGLGPSAHSYNLTSRQWNIQNLRVYIDEISKGKLPNETEILEKNEKYNDYIITSLRTMWGLNTEKIKNEFGEKLKNFFLENSEKLLEKKLLTQNQNNFKLTEKGMFISDNILSSFLWV